MSVKAEVLAILEANREEHISGEELAARLQVSRTSIWKAIKALRCFPVLSIILGGLLLS